MSVFRNSTVFQKQKIDLKNGLDIPTIRTIDSLDWKVER